MRCVSTKMSLYCHSILLKNEQKFAKIHKRPRAGKSERGLKIKGFQGFRGNGEIITTMFPKPLRRVRLPYPAPKKVYDESRGLFLASTRRSASRLDSNYLTAEVNSAYNNSPLRCELTRDFARGTRRTLKSTGASELPLCKCFCAAKAFYGAKAPRGTEWVRVPAPIGSARRSCRGAAMRDGVRD